MTLSWGYIFLFFSISAFLCVWPGTPPFPISNFLLQSYLYYWNSTHTGVDVIHSPHSTFWWSLPNFNSAPISTLSRHAMLHECSKTCICLWMQSTLSDLKKRFPKRPCHIAAQSGQFVMAMWPWPGWGDPRRPSSPQPPLKLSLCYCIAPEWWWSCGTIGTATLPPLPCTGYNIPIYKSTWDRIARCCALAVLDNDGGVRRGHRWWWPVIHYQKIIVIYPYSLLCKLTYWSPG